MRRGKHDATLYQDGLDTFFDSLLCVETQHSQEDVRGMPLSGKSEVAPGVTRPVLGTAG